MGIRNAAWLFCEALAVSTMVHLNLLPAVSARDPSLKVCEPIPTLVHADYSVCWAYETTTATSTTSAAEECAIVDDKFPDCERYVLADESVCSTMYCPTCQFRCCCDTSCRNVLPAVIPCGNCIVETTS